MLGLIAPRRCHGCDDIVEDQDLVYCAADFDLLQKERENEVSVALKRAKYFEAKALELLTALREILRYEQHDCASGECSSNPVPCPIGIGRAAVAKAATQATKRRAGIGEEQDRTLRMMKANPAPWCLHKRMAAGLLRRGLIVQSGVCCKEHQGPMFVVAQEKDPRE